MIRTLPSPAPRGGRLLPGLLLLLVVSLAARPAADDRPAEWTGDDYAAVGRGGERALDPEEPQGDEELDAVTARAVGPGSTALLDLLGIPRRDAVKESLAKGRERAARRDQLFTPEDTGRGGGRFFVGPDLAGGAADAADEAQEGEDEGGIGLKNLRVVSSDYLEVDVENLRVFGARRTRLDLGRFQIEADRIHIDIDLREAYAAGNVTLTDPDSGLEISAEALNYNFETFTGQAYKVRGERGEFFLVNDELEVLPDFVQTNEREALIANGRLTGNDFPVPTYYIRGKELVLVSEERIFVLHATLFVRDWPLAYFPVYTLSLNEKNAWSLRVGQNDGRPRELGLFGLLSYDHYYKNIEPDPLDDKRYLRRSFARYSPSLFVSEELEGVGLDAAYDYDYGKHKGQSFVFVLPQDEGREMAGGEEQEPISGPNGEAIVGPAPDTDEQFGDTRWLADIKHRTELARDLDLLLNVDWVSDSEVYYDIFDEITNVRQGRQFERYARAALTWRFDDVIARLRAEEVERVTRNRVSVTYEAGDDDADFDENPNNTMLRWEGVGDPPPPEEIAVILDDEPLADGEDAINNQRFATVSRRLPEVNVATNRVRLSTLPFYWTLDFRAFRNLDKGLNAFAGFDDAEVVGADLYNSITFVYNITDRLAWQHQVGVGVGHASRSEQEWQLDRYIPAYPATLNGIRFVDESTFLVGEREVSLDDVEETFIYGDYVSRLTQRFTEELEGNVAYVIREGTEDTLFELYEKIGMTEARKDVYDYRPYIHRISAGLDYEGLYPRIDANVTVGANLQGDDDIYANEVREFASTALGWTSLDDVWKISAGLAWLNAQVRDTTDENAFEQQSVAATGQLDWFPAHERQWAQIKATYFETLDEDPVADQVRAENPDDPFLTDEDEGDDSLRYQVTGVYGFRVGPKYEIELQARYDEEEEDFDKIALVIQRDLYDAVALVEFAWKLKSEDDDDDPTPEDQQLDNDTRDYEREFEIGFGFGFRIPNTDRQFGVGRRDTLGKRRAAEIELGG